jgi:hypothetical protein
MAQSNRNIGKEVKKLHTLFDWKEFYRDTKQHGKAAEAERQIQQQKKLLAELGWKKDGNPK